MADSSALASTTSTGTVLPSASQVQSATYSFEPSLVSLFDEFSIDAEDRATLLKAKVFTASILATFTDADLREVGLPSGARNCIGGIIIPKIKAGEGACRRWLPINVRLVEELSR